jgi:hypothetical protein
MKHVKYTAGTALVLLSTYSITRWWLGTAWSERYWTWLNHQFGGQSLGLASDVELITVMLLALLTSVGAVIATFRLVARFQQDGKR